MKENCAECKYHDVFWKGSGCVLLNSMERCKFKPIKEAQRVPEAERRMSMSEEKPMTNGDKIRAMSDVALADFLEGEYGNMMPGTALDFLKHPADNDKNG